MVSGHVAPEAEAIPEGKYSADLELLDRFTGFSGELVRIALLGIAALGFFIEKLMPNFKPTEFGRDAWLPLLLSWAAALLGLAVVFGLLHRYYATDGVAFHVAWLRYKSQGRPDADIKEQAAGRRRSYKLSEGCLVTSACSVASGAIVLGIAFFIRFSVPENERASTAMFVAAFVTATGVVATLWSWWRILSYHSGLAQSVRAEA